MRYPLTDFLCCAKGKRNDYNDLARWRTTVQSMEQSELQTTTTTKKQPHFWSYDPLEWYCTIQPHFQSCAQLWPISLEMVHCGSDCIHYHSPDASCSFAVVVNRALGRTLVLLCGYIVGVVLWLHHWCCCVATSLMVLCGYIIGVVLWLHNWCCCVASSLVLFCDYIIGVGLWSHHWSCCVATSLVLCGYIIGHAAWLNHWCCCVATSLVLCGYIIGLVMWLHHWSCVATLLVLLCGYIIGLLCGYIIGVFVWLHYWSCCGATSLVLLCGYRCCCVSTSLVLLCSYIIGVVVWLHYWSCFQTGHWLHHWCHNMGPTDVHHHSFCSYALWTVSR